MPSIRKRNRLELYRLVTPQRCGARQDWGTRIAAQSQNDPLPPVFMPPREFDAMDWASGSKIERRSFILPVQRSCREDRLPGASASPASPSKTQQALQLNTRNQPPSCAFLCRPVESVESSILLPSVARGKENASHREGK